MDKGLQRDAATAAKGGEFVSCIHTYTHARTHIHVLCVYVHTYICVRARVLSYIIPLRSLSLSLFPLRRYSFQLTRLSSPPRERSISRQRCRVLHNSLAMLPDLYERRCQVRPVYRVGLLCLPCSSEEPPR